MKRSSTWRIFFVGGGRVFFAGGVLISFASLK